MNEIVAEYRSALYQYGEPVKVRRYTGTGSTRVSFDVEAYARVIEYQPQDLVGSIQQGDRQVVLFAHDLIDNEFPLPLLTTDKLVIRGKEVSIQALDDNSRRVGNTLIAYELRVRG